MHMKKYITYVDGFQSLYIKMRPQKQKEQLKAIAYIEVPRKHWWDHHSNSPSTWASQTSSSKNFVNLSGNVILGWFLPLFTIAFGVAPLNSQ